MTHVTILTVLLSWISMSQAYSWGRILMKSRSNKRVYNTELDNVVLNTKEQELVSKLLGVKRVNVKSGFFKDAIKKKTLADEWHGRSAKRVSAVDAIKHARAITR